MLIPAAIGRSALIRFKPTRFDDSTSFCCYNCLRLAGTQNDSSDCDKLRVIDPISTARFVAPFLASVTVPKVSIRRYITRLCCFVAACPTVHTAANLDGRCTQLSSRPGRSARRSDCRSKPAWSSRTKSYSMSLRSLLCRTLLLLLRRSRLRSAALMVRCPTHSSTVCGIKVLVTIGYKRKWPGGF